VEGTRLGDPVQLFYNRAATLPSGPPVFLPSTMSARLADIDECTLDAAVLEVDPALFPTVVRPIPVPSVAPNDPVSMQGLFTSATGRVLRVFQHPPYFGNLFGQRLIIDCTGVRGDSGTLIEPMNASGAIGLYMGTIPDGANGRDGIVQDMAQIARFFAVEPHQ
jgi:hypothetical protein